MSYHIDRKKWANKSIFYQMGNIYSEVGRSFAAKSSNRDNERDQAINRALDLFDATLSTLEATKSPKVREVLRSKEQFLGLVYDPKAAQEDIDSLDRYFYQFAYAERLKH